MFRNPHTLFRALAILEAISWTLLIAGLILRAATDWASTRRSAKWSTATAARVASSGKAQPLYGAGAAISVGLPRRIAAWTL